MPTDLGQVMAALGHSRLSRSLFIPASLQSRTTGQVALWARPVGIARGRVRPY
jgi:hypothetical protein